MSVFEIAMLVCFGAAWPFSIARSLRTKSVAGKSVAFLWIVLAGYMAGMTHKWMYSLDGVIVFYAVNAIMVAMDIAFYYRNLRLAGNT